MCGSFNNNFDNYDMRNFMQNIIGSYPDKTVRFGDIYPGYDVPILTVNQDGILPIVLRWGYNGFDSNKLIYNARSETVSEKPYFRKDFNSRRCVVPVAGFYEWSKDKTKYYYKAEDNSPLYLGAFYNIDRHESFVILTQDAVSPVDTVHHRSPIILNRTQIENFILGSMDSKVIESPKLICADSSNNRS